MLEKKKEHVNPHNLQGFLNFLNFFIYEWGLQHQTFVPEFTSV